MKEAVIYVVIKGNSFICEIGSHVGRSIIPQNVPKCPKASHCPTPHEPGQWDRTGQRNNQRKKEGGKP